MDVDWSEIVVVACPLVYLNLRYLEIKSRDKVT